jgi:hypothetical protein
MNQRIKDPHSTKAHAMLILLIIIVSVISYTLFFAIFTPRKTTLLERLMTAGDSGDVAQIARVWSEIADAWNDLPEPMRVDCMRGMYMKTICVPREELAKHKFLEFFCFLYHHRRPIEHQIKTQTALSMIDCCVRTACGVGVGDK